MKLDTKRSDLSIDFVKEDSLTTEDYNKITAVIKDKKIIQEAVNAKRYKPSKVIDILRRIFKMDNEVKFNASCHHSKLCQYYKIKPINKTDNPFDTRRNIVYMMIPMMTMYILRHGLSFYQKSYHLYQLRDLLK